jgi:hypothetical protein
MRGGGGRLLDECDRRHGEPTIKYIPALNTEIMLVSGMWLKSQLTPRGIGLDVRLPGQRSDRGQLTATRDLEQHLKTKERKVKIPDLL